MRNHIGIFITGIVLAVMVFLAISQQQHIVDFLNKNKLLPQPEPFTELYFEDHLNLPKTLEATEEANFKFTVHNLEYKPMDYEYSVEAIASDSSRLIKQGSFKLLHDEYATFEETVSTAEAKQRTKININLDNIDQSIHFWVNE